MSQTQSPLPPAPSDTRPPRVGHDRLSQRLGMVALELALLGAAWYLLQLRLYVVAAFGAVIIAGGLAPHRLSGIVWGVGLLGLAAGAYFYVGHETLAILLALFGVVSLASGMPRLKTGY